MKIIEKVMATIGLTCLVLLVEGLLVAPAGYAQDQSDNAGNGEESGEVVVIAELNRREVRQYIEEAEDQLYEIFNANNEDDEFDISCYDFTPTGSNISRRVCEPEFLIDARGANVNDARQGVDELLTPEGLRAEHQAEFQELTEKMQALAQENAQFAQVANILSQLRARQQQLGGN